MIDLFVHDGEYGTAAPTPPDIIAVFRKRHDQLKSKIVSLESKRTRRGEGIKLIMEDIDLLEQILQHRDRGWMADAILIDS
ncbi:MAG: hypothetical protein A2W72_05895 [Burkholderiales bacterium RIFCSPLOWO2_12_67_14]|nr:MAG: hypothetical protein A3I64_23140 [Burkholderiales bacterium RIFCSPLOWO2_02_FULL_67_64]OGB40557.1 MAG: hypothetical protein A3E51_18830 [Burkholderiales bacterium RIFCSPHIGHO2_12_FULL_67_38]OGB47566.1 MAG: hypothetical protein A2W72_05895 [Burkholderiales bacterium RIFCSPLOWO2_12_67_14]OGB79833.1 MAG: hypothetical protein A3G82_16050 [Burkholderiales bacterium RIFCSPLOWO2_12_FULL_67_210]